MAENDTSAVVVDELNASVVNPNDSILEVHSDEELISQEAVVSADDEILGERSDDAPVDNEKITEDFEELANESIVPVAIAEGPNSDATATDADKTPDAITPPSDHPESSPEDAQDGKQTFADHAELVAGKLHETLAGAPVVDPSDAGEAGIFASIFNIANTILGAGTVTLPFAFKSAGLVFGGILIIVSFLVMMFSMRVLVRACHRLSPRVYSYRALAVKCFGGWAGPVIELLIALLTTGVLIAYTIIIGDYVSSLAKSYLPFIPFLHSPLVIRIIVMTFIIFPLCCLKSLRLLSFTSGISVACVLFTTVFVFLSCLYSLSQGSAAILTNSVTWFKFDLSAFMAISLYSTAFAAHFTLPSIYQELKKKELSLLSPPETPAPESESPGATIATLQFIGHTTVRRTNADYPEVKDSHVEEGEASPHGSGTHTPTEPFAVDGSALGNMSPLGRSRAGSLSRREKRALMKQGKVVKSGSDKDWRRIWASLSLGLTICLIVYTIVGVSGYLEFGDEDTKDNILMSYTGTNIARDMALAAMSTVITFSMPLVHFATRQSILNAAWSVFRRRPYTFGWPSHVVSAAVLLLCILIVATLIPSVSLVFNILFSIGGVLIYFACPALFYLRFRTSFQSKTAERSTWKSQLTDKSAWAAVVLVVITVPLGAVSLLSNFA
ncbi:Amino acid transporter, transmembrane [Carpediemonas membranifera]|uniref:Amino acid transporter, transmembrane n=1 Tax=Carpediemonas membranifera TaxID=201153 RepID=A0A8J6B283_9EUKA|nr:Amino acid transporter, transmembrane [Carpediemonas membranifera]|eukprot:KAG9391319.1 Amino acid transporter, transmembrane [Carpediemonas membranifera]